MSDILRTEIMEEYRARRAENAREDERRKKEVSNKDPRIAQLIEKRHEMIMFSLRSAFERVEPGDLEARMKEYNARIRALLVENGFPPDYLEPVCSCHLCGDTGYVGDTLKRECVCLKRRLAAAADRVSDDDKTFARFDESVFPEFVPDGLKITQREEMRRVRAVCEEYADAFPAQSPRDLLLYGTSGLGKTYLLSCVAQRVREHGHEALCVTAYDALARLRDAFFGRADETGPLFESELLLLNDLGMEPLMENVTLEQLYHLVNTRRQRGLAMVVSTNLSMAELKARYTERISSRLLDVNCCRVIRLMGRDVRLIKR